MYLTYLSVKSQRNKFIISTYGLVTVVLIIVTLSTGSSCVTIIYFINGLHHYVKTNNPILCSYL